MIQFHRDLDMIKKNLEIHSENILPIIKKWLYSDKDIFVRELVSNACDAIRKVKVLREQEQIQANDEDFKVEIQIDKDSKTIKFIDNGIGMDAEEVQKYIAQIAFSGAEEFVHKYKTNEEKDQFIGHFGLGFYSAYMVASKVEINTLSYKEGAEPVFWSCDGSSEYTIEKGNRATRGTEITLFVDKDNEEYLDDYRLKQVMLHYCSFLPYPVYLGTTHINTQEPLWIKNPADCTQKDYLDFYHHLYPMEEDPLFWVHLNADYPFHLKGILYFPKVRRDYDNEKNTVKLYCSRVFVSDNCKDVIPNYLMALRGIIDSPDIPLNVSRSYLQVDRTVRQLSGHIAKKVFDSLATLYRNERERFVASWEDISIVVKLGILEDDKLYERVKDFLIWKTVEGEWITAQEYLDRYREKTAEKIYYTKDEQHMSSLQALYKNQGIGILCANHPVDVYVMQHLERQLTPVVFQRVDAALAEHIVDKEREKTILDASGKTEAAKLADFIRAKLKDDKIEVEAKSLASDALPGFILQDENQRRMRDYMVAMNPKEGASQFAHLGKKTFVVNTNNVLINAIYKLEPKNSELASALVKEAYELALLSQREMDPSLLEDFISRTVHILEKLAQEVTQEVGQE
ncbi:Chaperone protein htpG [Neochlamydia sp. AcF65]|nr:Chaperone protein htpG [Neochlamydia sp. AcF65]MBS4171633.1 Chaperone protein htpG [Neochlamydia sp. AcF95]